ncbi:flagellar assembly protein FliW [Anaerosinus sp.]|uniref:flagellar assembly protein FliW n=1 Tax=Selenobaculum sp. TaxID=3074374 RepID=UPI0015AF6049
MKSFTTTRFGKIEVGETDIIKFVEGIPGFPEEKEFVMIPFGENEPFVFMQSLREPDLAFLLTDPFLFFKEYEFVLSDELLEELEIREQSDFNIYCILSIPDKKVKNTTANLAAPLIVQNHTKQAIQLILEKTTYTTRHRLFQEESAERGN